MLAVFGVMGLFRGLVWQVSRLVSIVVGYVAAYTKIAFLWHNLIGAVVVFAVGMLVSEITGPTTRP